MNPLSLLPPPPSNFFSDLPSLPPSSPHHGTNTPGWLAAASNERTRPPRRTYIRVRVRVLFTARARIGRSTLKILFFFFFYSPTYQTRTSCTYCTRDTIVEPVFPPCVPRRLFFFRFLFLNFLAHFFSNSRPLLSATLRALLRDQRDKVPLPRRS